ncbi:MAG: PQQ-dependent sugar dehydrogenase [Pirellulales bacterium]
MHNRKLTVKFHTIIVIGMLSIWAGFVPTLEASVGNSLTIERVANVGVGGAVFATHSPDPLDADKLFTVHQGGQIRIVDLQTNRVRGLPFLSVPGGGGESGLVGLTFHPNYATNGRFFINRHDGSQLRIEEYERSGSSYLANPTMVRSIWTHTQHSGAHNAGWIGFNPKETIDGKYYLWRTLGDGGGPGGGATPGVGEDNNDAQHDPHNRSQTLGEPHGSVVRIDIGDAEPIDAFVDANNNYSIPADNPFASIISNGQPHVQGREVYARGLRHPWRASFDRATGDLYLGEVSQDVTEEINLIPYGDNSGLNFGWRLRDGLVATRTEWVPPQGGTVGGPEPLNNAAPIYQYLHTSIPTYVPDPGVPQDLRGNSVTGGFVYRGPVSALNGHYFFGDFGPGKLWSLTYDGSNPSNFDGDSTLDFINWNNSTDNTITFTNGASSLSGLAGFGEDQAGNVYLVRHSGEILRIAAATVVPSFPQGDFDLDYDADGNDFLKWQRGESPNPLSTSNLAAWKANFGIVASPNTTVSTTIPEPATGVILLIGLTAMLIRRRLVLFEKLLRPKETALP